MNSEIFIKNFRKLLPEDIQRAIDRIELKPLKNKIDIPLLGKQSCCNLVIYISKSPYRTGELSGVLCKVFGGKLYFPKLKEKGVLSLDDIKINKIIADHIENLFPEETFGCCNLYVSCSDKKKCLHSDPFHARGCMYRKNLESGKIFYGVNKNV